MNKQLLFKTARKGFCEKYHYHHDFKPEYLQPNGILNSSLVLFDFTRIFFYMVTIATCVYSFPLYTLFRRTKFVDNPDYLIHHCSKKKME